MGSITHAAERKLFEVAVDAAMNHVSKDREKAMIQFIDLMQKVLGNTWKPEAFDKLRGIYENPDSKWNKFTNDLFDSVDLGQLKSAALNLGYEAGFRGYKTTQENSKKYGCNIPWILLFDPTSACNLHCTGCWAAEYGHQMNLSYEDMDRIVTQAEELGIHAFLMTGGEPTVRMNDIWKLCEKHNHSFFSAFTNGTLIDDKFCENMLRLGNFTVNISVEGFQNVNDARRGAGDFEKVMKAMDCLKAHRLAFGTSICYTSANYKVVTSDEFLDMLIEHGVKWAWYFHYMPVGNAASTDLLLTPEQREYMYHRVREIRGFEGGKPIFTMDFQNDGEFIHGCIAGGRVYCHINPNGDVEPCVFIHYSSANIHDKSLLECLQQPLFKAYQQNQPFNDNHLRPCPMLENPQVLREMVRETGAHSTDMESKEDVDHLCSKCDRYAKDWAVTADRLWKSNHPDYEAQKEEKTVSVK
ncbi:MAG TPA: pyrroloquinoline quinone biosynthesis protein PqqE [Lachnospiraceae bacterium]|jgi:MoaA/NifB/PqqE/SkfB family radical SAM enzyme|nr:radical SAM protein [Lachnospiraceae bacterium]HAP72764.1 pyrroloquinoline quinone biosynthesis protein PqqE [Lachnospiraceae bacterium]